MNPLANSPSDDAPRSALGMVDRYELRGELAETAVGMVYDAQDTVAGTRVSLLFLPAPFATPGALDVLRPRLAAIARFRHPGVAHLLHLTQLWEIDAAARAETGIESGAAALVSDLPDGTPLTAWRATFPAKQPPVDDVLDLAWELAEAIDGLHADGIVHGSLTPTTIRITPHGPVLMHAAVELRVRIALADQGHGQPLPEATMPDKESDRLALAKLVADLLPNVPDAPWQPILERALGIGGEPPFSSCRQFAGALREAVENAQDEGFVLPCVEAGSEAAPPPIIPQPVPPALPAAPASEAVALPLGEPQPAKRKGNALWINIALGVAALAVLALAAAVLRRPSAAAPEPSLPWQPIRQDTRLSPTFAYRAILPAPQADQTLRVRLYGQTRIVALVLSADRITVEERTGKTESRELAAVTPTNWQDGDELTIVKTPDSLSAYRNGERLIATPCPLEQWRMVRWDALGDFEPSNASFQKIGRLVFADDFMHGENELGQWRPESGEWTVHELQNPIRSANPFSFLGTGDNAVAAAGQWFWRNYRVAASAHPLPGASFGISFCRRGPDTAYDLRWSHVGPDAVLELSRIHAGQRQSLARQPLPCRANGWVQLAASQLDGLIVVLVDGRPVLSVTDSAPLCGGGVALWTDGGEGTVFDDVSVGPVDRVSLTPDASIPGTILPSGSLGTTTDREECLIGGVLLGNATVEATVACSGRTSPLGLVARANGAKQLRFQLVPGTPWQAQVVAVTPGGETVLASEDTAAPDGEATLGFTVLDNEAWGTVGGKIAVYAPQVRTVGQGLTGLFARGEPIRATRLAVSPTSPLPSIDNRVETFTHEQSMQNWNSPVLAWTPDYSGSLPLYWHRSDFWRDVSVQADIEGLRKQSSVSAWGVAMAAEGGTDDGPEPRWELYATPGTSEIFVQRPGQEPIQIPFTGELRTLALERRGNRILAKPNGHVVWQDRLPDKGDGLLRVGRIGRGATDEWAQAVAICADSLRTYSFKEAPVDWLPAAGEWKITNRWECDPRWSFFSGVQRGGPACLWSKLQHGRNVTIEFFVGPKMDRDRGKWYEYAADFNAVICADGQDISSGYSFLFGGWNDRGSQIVRRHEILAENRNITIPRKSSTHRRWFHVKIRKRGDQLTFWVDGAVVGTARDDSPLAGNRFGLWTYDNGIMVAQVRIATNGELSAVDLGTVPKSRPLTPYDKQP